MTIERPARRLSNRLAHCFFQAVETEMGLYGLHVMLQQAGLQRCVDHLPPVDDRVDVLATEFAAFQQHMRVYLGRGARGALNRIGHAAWLGLVDNAAVGWKFRVRALRWLPRAARARQALELLAAWLRQPDGKVSVHLLDIDLILMDQSSDTTYGQAAEEPICWVTLGMIQGALAWALGEECDVEEFACRALGAEACKFRVKF
jgi:predicted hydrocarbon binding protein